VNEIDRQLVSLVPHRRIAKRFNLNASAVHRHKHNHLNELLRQAVEREVKLKAADLVSWLRDRTLDLRRIAARAEKKERFATATGAIREERRFIESIARLRGDLKDSPFQLPPPLPMPTFSGLNVLIAQVPSDSAGQLAIVETLRTLGSLLADPRAIPDPREGALVESGEESSGLVR
jgi:hypothetical protein